MAYQDGHRQRVKERFAQEGLESFRGYEVLELLLYYSIPRIDTKIIAKRLIENFGSFAGVLEASPEDLQRVEGIGPGSANFISLINAVNRYYKNDKAKNNKPLKTVEEFGFALAPMFTGRRTETVYLLCLDARCRKICCRQVGEGSATSAGLSVRKIVETALAVNATSVVLAHNHPDGVAVPSRDDLRATSQIQHALSTVGITLVDHLIFAEDDYISVTLSGAY